MKEHPRVVATIEARMTSSRLPGKVLMPAGGVPMLQILIERLRRAQSLHDIVVATTTNAQDDPVVELCERIGTRVFRGSEPNVLQRVCDTARSAQADIIVEITADCPLVDPAMVDEAVALFLRVFPGHRYVTNSEPCQTTVEGFDIRVCLADDLYAMNDNDPDEMDREHVSYGFYRPESNNRYNPKCLEYPAELARNDLKITLDYPEDYELIRACYEELSAVDPAFGAREIIRWIDAHPELRDRVLDVHQRRG